MTQNNESCSDERLAEIIFDEGDLGAFNREYWHPELRKYEGRHEAVLDSLRRGTRHHLKGNFSDYQFADVVPKFVKIPEDVVDNMWYNSYDCTHHQKSEEFYNMFKDEVCRNVTDNILPKLKCVAQLNLLEPLATTWKIYKTTMSVFEELFKHLTLWIEDVPEDEKPKDGIEKIGLNAFKNKIVLEEHIVGNLTSVLMKRTEEHRKGIDVDNETIRAVCDLLVEMDCYEKVFKEEFLKEAESHFKKVASESLKTMSSHEYVKNVENLIANEKESNSVYGNVATTESTTKVLEKVLIKDQLEAIFYEQHCGAVPKMLRLKEKDQLKCVYVTVKRVDGGLEKLKDCLSDFIGEEAENILKDFDRKLAVEYIEKFIQLKKTCNDFILESFGSNHDLSNFTDAKFSEVVSDIKIAESLSTFIDRKFRSIKNDDVNEICDGFMLVFKAMEVKDLFKIVFNKQLCKRLIDPKNFLLENEKILIENLKTQCGDDYTQQSEALIKDFQSNETALREFKSQNNTGPVTSIHVISNLYWPWSTGDLITMPPCVLEAYNKFSDFYMATTSNKKTLRLVNNHGTAEVHDFVPDKINRTLEVNHYQLAVLLLFNRQEQWTVQDLLNECNISIDNMKNVLGSLAFGKMPTRVLAKVSSGKEILPTDSFKVIENQCKHRRVRIPMKSIMEEDETKQSLQTFNKDCKLRLQSAVVQVMKSKKVLDLNSLIAEVVNEVKNKFTVERRNVEVCIEKMIERDYLERDPEDNNKYLYKA